MAIRSPKLRIRKTDPANRPTAFSSFCKYETKRKYSVVSIQSSGKKIYSWRSLTKTRAIINNDKKELCVWKILYTY
uniref:Uncharacterized protein n=1 Tax=Setaria italica TaxID=4555 RepID=K4AHJ6_SETIT